MKTIILEHELKNKSTSNYNPVANQNVSQKRNHRWRVAVDDMDIIDLIACVQYLCLLSCYKASVDKKPDKSGDKMSQAGAKRSLDFSDQEN